MLVLTRKKGERFLIAPDIEVVILSIRPDRVRVGVVAPQGTKILREELVAKEVKA
jgi:carbon storage regulator